MFAVALSNNSLPTTHKKIIAKITFFILITPLVNDTLTNAGGVPTIKRAWQLARKLLILLGNLFSTGVAAYFTWSGPARLGRHYLTINGTFCRWW